MAVAATRGESDLITATGWVIVGLECQNYMIECRVNIDLHRHRGGLPLSQAISQGRLEDVWRGIADKKEGGEREGGVLTTDM